MSEHHKYRKSDDPLDILIEHCNQDDSQDDDQDCIVLDIVSRAAFYFGAYRAQLNHFKHHPSRYLSVPLHDEDKIALLPLSRYVCLSIDVLENDYADGWNSTLPADDEIPF